jgi:DNA-binding MurR/RpiR family transcriptional regulator
MSVLSKIKALKNTFTVNEQSIAGFIIEKPESVKNYSSQQLAQAIGVSQSSIVKFTQKLGYKGYPALKLALVEAVNDSASGVTLQGDITLNDSIAELSEKLLGSKIKVLSDTMKANDGKAFELVVDTMLNANKILICGIGASALVAKDFSYKLQKMGIPAIAESNGHAQLAFAATFQQGDLLICISESGKTAEVVAAAELAKQNGAKVIAITGGNRSKLRKTADSCLFTIAESSELRLSSILSRTSQELIIDTLFVTLSQKSQALREQIERSNAAVGSYIDNN